MCHQGSRVGVFPCGFSFVVNGAIDMYDKSLIAHLLPPEMIIKNYIHGDPDCNYEKYLLEFVNASDFFRVKSDGDIYQSPESEENGQCDCISTSYQFDFKLIASKTALQARSILYPSKTEIVKGIIVTSEPKVTLTGLLDTCFLAMALIDPKISRDLYGPIMRLQRILAVQVI